MSVPLDRLYNFLHDVCNRDDLIIYRFFPHGSRKIEDLTRLFTSSQNHTKFNYHHDYDVLLKYVFFCDQEPLHFDFYNKINFLTQSLQVSKYILNLDADHLKKYYDVGKKVTPYMNLKWAHGLDLCKYPCILVHSEKRSTELKRYEGIQFIGVFWWSHALIALDWFRYAKIDPALNKKNIKYDFLIYNRAWSGTREYRIKFSELVLQHKLNKHCLTWFNETDNNQHYLDHQFTNPKFSTKNENLPIEFQPSQANSNYSADYNSNDYQNSAIEVVLETLFDDSRLHLTEKILRPISCGQPFILAATHGSLEYLRSYGFETFSNFIDETYDTIQDPLQRLEAIIAEMLRIARLPKKQKTSLYKDLQKIAQRNKKLFFSSLWEQRIIDEYCNNMKLALNESEQLLQLPQFYQ